MMRLIASAFASVIWFGIVVYPVARWLGFPMTVGDMVATAIGVLGTVAIAVIVDEALSE